MKLTTTLAILAVAGTLGTGFGAGGAQAQIREQQPSEFPPSSYKGKQYVDSKGCVFIRAGIDGDVSWVPRVTRDRKTVCGFKPTNAGTAVAEAPSARPPAQKPVVIKPVAPAAAAAPAPARVAQAAPRPAAAPKPRKRAPVVVRQTAPKPKPRVVAAPKVVAPAPQVKPTTVAQAQSGCRGASAISAQYLRGEGVRCGPQAEPIVGNRSYGQGTSAGTGTSVRTAGTVVHAAPAEVTAHTRIVPKHVAKARKNTTNVSVPKGYKPVWEDDRLNPYRAEQTLAGRSDMLLVWTQTLPRRLINQHTGRDVTASVPLIYPYTSEAQQRSAAVEVQIVRRDGKIMKRVVRNSASKPVARKPVYSTRSTPKAVAKAAPKAAAPVKAYAGKKFVQVGTYRNPANAQRAAQSIARMGMPARIGKRRSGGQTLMTVQAGPFNGSRALGTAMSRLRGAGYSDAFAK